MTDWFFVDVLGGGIKLTQHKIHHFNYFKVNNSGPFSTFMKLYNYHHCLVPEYHHKRKPCTPIHLPLVPGNL